MGATAHPRWIIDEVAEVGPAGPAAATPQGVVLVSRDNDVLMARWTPPSPAAGRQPLSTQVQTIERSADSFAPFARGPAILRQHAYWVSKGRLVRHGLSGGSLEVLTKDARDYTRVVAAETRQGFPPAVAYIAKSPSDEQLVARLWAEAQPTRTLSPEGSTAISVALASTGDKLISLSIEGRMGMSPVHTRRIDLAGKGVDLEPDSVVWVAGPTHPLTEIHAAGSTNGHVSCFLPVERDSTRFGLARFLVEPRPGKEVSVFWRDYPNGLQPSPVSVATACGQTVIAYARPIDAAPHAPQELHLCTLGADGLGASTVVAGARAFSDVSMAAIPSGLLLAYVADHHTWARTVRCGGPF